MNQNNLIKPRGHLPWWERLRFIWVMVALLLFVSLAITYMLVEDERNRSMQDLQSGFNLRVRDVESRIRQRMELYEQVLFGAQGLFTASVAVDRDNFRIFAATMRIGKSLPGIQGVAFSLLVPAAQQDQHIAAMHKEGYPAYTIHPGGKRDITTPTIYIEPFNARNQRAFGYDMYSEPVRRAAMDRARDDTKIAVSILTFTMAMKCLSRRFCMMAASCTAAPASQAPASQIMRCLIPHSTSRSVAAPGR